MRVLVFIFLIIPSLLQAQDKVLLSGESSYVKSYLVQYLVKNGSAESIQDSSYLFARQLQKIGTNEADGVFSFGLMESHAKEYIFLRGNGEIVILDLADIGESLNRLGSYLKQNQVTDPKKIKSIIDDVFAIVDKNQMRLPSYGNDN